MGHESVDRQTEINNQKVIEEMIDTRKSTIVHKIEEAVATTVPKDKGPRIDGAALMQKYS